MSSYLAVMLSLPLSLSLRIHSAAGFWDIAAQEMNLLREIFKKREPVFQSTLPSESFLCSRSSPLLIKNMDVMRAAELFSHPDWEEEVESYLACITDDVVRDYFDEL